MRLVVVGAGRVGLAVLEALKEHEGDEVVVIDSDSQRVVRARRRFGEIRGIEGDATDEKVLRAAGVADADAVIIATPDDPVNLMVASLARRLGTANVVCRVTDEDVAQLHTEIGATPIRNPSNLTAEHLYHAFEVPGVRAFMTVGEDAEIVTLAIGQGSKLAGRTVKEARFPRDALLIAVNRGDHVRIPTGDMHLREGDVLTLVARSHLLDHLVGRVMGRPGRLFAGQLRGMFRR